ncbi:c-type cytochrome [Pseudofulvimonas gallinarii]|jgi:cytochrome c553|uniref:Cytochrome c553 n=1 Tax=Pseudofulvimonas gallinarii TaxID=634155 RepID=A0A4R3LFY4_9GAMM|nr:c-type cytochrome [Pseudofulvimonas gallinarii]TCS98882.1 cytochrome c553 [Pseudofulvimonas gallinarii]
MSKRLIALAGLVSFTAFAAEAPLVGDPQAGSSKAATCAACHGMDGNSTMPNWPKLAGQHSDYVSRQTRLIRDGGREVFEMMPFVQDLTDQDIADIAAYFATQTGRAGVADDSPVVGRDDGVTYAALGEKLYRSGKMEQGVPACIACHGAAGRGVPGSGYPSLAGQHATYTAARLRFFESGGHYDGETDPSTVMSTIAGRLESSEIDALATYIEGLHRAPRGPQPAVRAAAAPAQAAPAVEAEAEAGEAGEAEPAEAESADTVPGT